ncbi:MAG: nitrous oxide reductase accessory protein NosL [Planctomycetes bacterium]|nr:nitrous oxide reductase accessory protein NosL [Planctomycetota bacterium]
MTRSLARLVIALLLAGCPAPDAGAGPPTIRWGADACDRCQMIINEERHAAAYVTVDGEARRFDDIGCLLARPGETGERPAAVWLRGEDGAWVAGEAATLVRAPDVVTPMGSGLVAFADPARARAFAAERGGEVVALAGLWP